MNNMPDRSFSISVFILLSLICGLGTVSCDQTFQPLRENNQYYFSINGYLDATVDTQWVRVMPVRDTLFYTPKPLDATVTLEELGSGRSVTMHDSLFSYPQDTYAYNFWTAMDLKPNRTYRITATNSEGQSSYADITLPEDYPGPIVDIIYYYPPVTPEPPIPDDASIVIPGVERVADFQTIYTTQDGKSYVAVPHLLDSVSSSSGDPAFFMDMRQDFDTLQTFLPMPDYVTEKNYLDLPDVKEYIYVAVATSDYKISGIEHAPPNGISNVENGVGFVAGIISKTVPFKSCYQEDRNILAPCPTVPPLW